jgi:Right handed beta helix region
MRRRQFLGFLLSTENLNSSRAKLSKHEANYFIINNLNELRDGNISLEKDSIVKILGYSVVGDCIMPDYKWDINEQQEDNGGSIICPRNRNQSGRWIAIVNEFLNVDWFGAGRNENDTTAIQAAIQAAIASRKKVVFTAGKIYKITSTIKANGTLILEGGGKLNTVVECFSSGVCFDLNGYGSEIRNIHFFNKNKNGGTALKISGRVYLVENLRFGGSFSICIHLVDVWESIFDKINILNSYPRREGVGFYIDYSTNNTISNSYLSFNETAIYFAPKYSSSNYRCEGWLISQCFIIDCLNGVSANGITHISIHGCIFDFIYNCAIYLFGGFSGVISHNWFAAAQKDVTLVKTHKNFNGVKITGNEFVGSIKKYSNQNSLLITGNQNIIGGNRHISIKPGRNVGKSNLITSDINLSFDDFRDD